MLFVFALCHEVCFISFITQILFYPPRGQTGGSGSPRGKGSRESHRRMAGAECPGSGCRLPLVSLQVAFSSPIHDRGPEEDDDGDGNPEALRKCHPPPLLFGGLPLGGGRVSCIPAFCSWTSSQLEASPWSGSSAILFKTARDLRSRWASRLPFVSLQLET